MANYRRFNCQGLVTNGVSVGGLSTIGFTARQAALASMGHAAVGAEDVDRLALACDVNLQCQDVDKVQAILAAAPGTTDWFTRESGAATYTKYSVPTAAAKIIWSSMSLTFPFGADATLDLRGSIQFIDGAQTMLTALVPLAAQTAPTLTFPARLYRPNTLSFTPEDEAAIAADHCKSVSLTLARPIIQDFGDADVCMSSVDALEWGPLGVTLVFQSGQFTDPSSIVSELTAAGRGVLTMNLEGRAGAPQQVLTINNLLLHDGGQTDRSDGYSEHRIVGSAGWRKYDAESPVEYTLTTLFTFV